MINADNRLITEVLPKVGADAFAIAFAIASHLRSKDKSVWPGVDRLRKMCPVEIGGDIKPMPKKRAYNAINRLICEGVVKRWQDNFNGQWGKTKYKITTPFIGIFMGADQFEMEDTEGQDDRVVEFDHTVSKSDHRVVKSRNAEMRNAEMRNAEFDHTEAIDEREAIDNKETIDKEGEAPAPEKEAGDDFEVVEIPIDYEPFEEKEKDSAQKEKAPQTADEVRAQIARAPISGDTIESRMAIWKICEPYLETEEFQNQWAFINSAHLPADPLEVVMEWVRAAAYYDVKEFRINKISKNWITNTIKSNSHGRNEKSSKGTIIDAESAFRAYQEFMSEGGQ